MGAPFCGSYDVCSNSAMPMPITTAPSIWFRPASGLIIRPASITVTTRLTRSCALVRLPRDFDEVTAGRVRREVRLWITERGFGLAAACNQVQVGAAQHICERHTARGAVSLHKDAATLEGQSRGLTLLERRARGCRGDAKQGCDGVVCRLENGRYDRAGRQRAAGERAIRKRRVAEGHFDFVERHTGLLRGELCEDRVCAGADVLRGACDTGRTIVAQLDACLGGETSGGP